MLEDPYEYQQPQRKTILPYLMIAAIVVGLITAATLYSAKVYPSSPTMIAKDMQGNWIRLRDEPCKDAADWLKLRKAEMYYQGKNYVACWRAEGGGVLVFDDNGDFSMVPIQAFQKDEGV